MPQATTNAFVLAAVVGAARLAQMTAAQSSAVNDANLTNVTRTAHWLVQTIEYLLNVALPMSLVWAAIFFFFFFLSYIVPRLASAVCLRCVAARHWVLFWQDVFAIVIVVYGSWLAFATIGVDVAGLLFSFGIISIAVSQGFVPLISNAVSALFMQTGPEITIGNTLEVAGIRGRIAGMDFRRVIIDPDDGSGSLVYVPNAILAETIHRVSPPRSQLVVKVPRSADSEARPVLGSMARVGGQANKFRF